MSKISDQKNNSKIPKQGEIWLAEFPPAKETRKPIRPVLIISENTQNEYDKWIVVVTIITEDIENIDPVEVFIQNTPSTGLDYPSKIQFNYPFTIDRTRLRGNLGAINQKIINQAKIAWKIVFDSEKW